MAAAAPSRVLLLGVENADGSVTGVTGAVASPWIDRQVDGILSFYLRGQGTISGGTLLIEEADWGPNEAPYSGTPSLIATVTLSALSGGAQQAYHIVDSSYGRVRVRVSSPVTGGGSVSCALLSRGAL